MRLFILLILISFAFTFKKDPWILGFSKTDINPVLTADSSFLWKDPITGKNVSWQKADVFNPAAIVKNDTIFLFYRAEDNPKAALGGRTSRIGLARSTDGINFIKYPIPVLYPDSGQFLQWDYPGGCEDPRVVRSEDGNYIMTYTSWNQDVARLSVASSKDLYAWKKHGPVFLNNQFKDRWSKSGSIVSKFINGQQTAVIINGLYWMYWGDTDVFLAHSQDLLDWTPVTNDQGELHPVMSPRDQMFDSQLVEPGPPALLTETGILLLYNSKNKDGSDASTQVAPGAYCGSQALFDKNDPSVLIKRMKEPFICPDLPHEVTGQYKAGTTFIEGLVPYKGRWYLYYGTADSMVGLAVSKVNDN